jgi:hypothetical protein
MTLINFSKRAAWILITLMLVAHAQAASAQDAEGARGIAVTVEALGAKKTSELRLPAESLTKKWAVELVTKPSPSPANFLKSLSRSSSNPAHQIGLNFTAATVGDVPNPNVVPPNLNGWVGEEQYVLMSYGVIRSFDKHTGTPDGVLISDAASFFNTQANDVRIDYDRFAKRWYFTSEITNPSTGAPTDLYLAVSSEGVIKESTEWFFYRFPNGLIIPQISPLGSGSLDYNQLAVDKNAVYISMDTFDQSGNFQGTSTLVVQKKSLLKGTPLATVFPGILGPDSVSPVFESPFTPPADNFDPDAKFGYLINAMYAFPFPEFNLGNQLFFFRIANPGTSQPTLSDFIPLTVPDFALPANAPHSGNLYGEYGFLQNGIFGGLEAPHVRGKQLYACHAIQVDSRGNADPNGDRIGVRWYQFDLTGDPSGKGGCEERLTTVPALVQWGTLFDADPTTAAPLSYFIPSIMTNKKKDMVITATVSGTNQFTNVIFASRSKKDPAGSLRNPVYVTQNFSNPYNFGPLVNPADGNLGQRWGIQVTQIKPL